MDIHPYADLLPAMSAAEFDALVEDVAKHGVRQPILTHEGRIVDGRHRAKAAEMLGLECPAIEWDRKGNLLEIALALNLHRRSMNAGQRACAACGAMPLLGKNAEDRMIKGKRPDPTPKMEEGLGEAAGHAAQMFGAGRQYVYDALMIRDADSSLFEQVFRGDITISQAKTILKQRENDELRARRAKYPTDTFSTLVVDPPWPMGKIERDVRPNQVKDTLDYPVMTIPEIEADPIARLAKEDCHLYLWTTQKHLPDAIRIATKHWGFKYQCLLTWVKNVGFTPFSWMYSTEYVVFATKGSLPLLKKGVRLDFNAKVREHSRKPDEFYEIVKTVSPGPRADVFSREKRTGFDAIGIEKDRF